MPSRTILFVTRSMEYGGGARQLTLLAAELARRSWPVRVAVLGTESPWVETLRREKVGVEVLGWRRPFDVLPFVKLRQLVRSMRPDGVHVWGATALRAVVLSGSHSVGRLLVSGVLSPARKPGRLDGWLLRRVAGILAFGATDAERYHQVGVAEARLTIVTPATVTTPDGAVAAPPGVAATDRVLLALGPIERHKGYREAVWAFDIVRHLYPDVHLVVAGTGPDRPRVEEFARQIGVQRHVHFLGAVADTAPLLQRAEVVWVPSLTGGGVNAALEAMAAGRPVVASRCPDLAEVVADGESGFLVEPDNKAALARQTRLLLDDPDLRRRFGEAGRRRAAEQFSIARLVESCMQRYTMDSGR
jgi:glycosyltransferase involved in cell wall biosynthesis